MPVVRNPQFNFREGFCWSDINTTYLKCRIKGKSVNDVKSMSLYGISDSVPEFYFVALINSTLFSYYVDSFVNNTQTFQINDARQLPILVPSKEHLSQVKKIYDSAIVIKKQEFANQLDGEDAEEKLAELQDKLDALVYSLYGIQ